MWHAFKKHDGKVLVASSVELKAKDITCSGWEVRRDRTVQGYLQQRNGWTVLLVAKGTEKSTDLEDGVRQCLLNVFTVYVPHSGKLEEKKRMPEL